LATFSAILESAVAVGFLDRIQVLALQVFYQRELQSFMIARVPYYHRNVTQPGLHSGAPAALAGDQLEPVVFGTDHQRLNNSLVANRTGEFGDFRLVERPARLEGARRDALDRNLERRRISARIRFGLGGARNERAQSSTQAFFRHRHCVLHE
jgi:hypothetical protein